MSKTNNYIYVEDFYQTTIQNTLSDSGDLTIEVTTPPINQKGFLVLSPDIEASKEHIEFEIKYKLMTLL